MRRAIAAYAALFLLLSGCATAISGIASINPLEQQLAADVSTAADTGPSATAAAGASTAEVSIEGSPTAAGTSLSRPSPTASESTLTASASTNSTNSLESSSEPTEIVPPPSEGGLSTAGNGKVTFDGFEYFDFEDGIYLRWAEDREYQCAADQVDGCWGLLVFSTTGCSAGVNVTLSISGPDGATVGTANGATAGLQANTQQLLILGDSTGSPGDPLAFVDSALCLGH